MAGVTEEGEMIRLYPIDYDYFMKKLNFSKFTLIEADVEKAQEKLKRKESFKVEKESIKLVDSSLAELPRSDKAKNQVWQKRKSIIAPLISKSIESLKEQWELDRTSLGVIKPILENLCFRKPLDEMEIDRAKFIQETLFGEKIKIPDKMEHIISYKYLCPDEACSTLHDQTCEDWELFEAIRDWRRRYHANVLEQKIKQKFFDWMKTRDLHFIVGMYSQYPQWMVIGLSYPPKSTDDSTPKLDGFL